MIARIISIQTGQSTIFNKPKFEASIQLKTLTVSNPKTTLIIIVESNKTKLVLACFHLLYWCFFKGYTPSKTQNTDKQPTIQINF